MPQLQTCSTSSTSKVLHGRHRRAILPVRRSDLVMTACRRGLTKRQPMVNGDETRMRCGFRNFDTSKYVCAQSTVLANVRVACQVLLIHTSKCCFVWVVW